MYPNECLWSVRKRASGKIGHVETGNKHQSDNCYSWLEIFIDFWQRENMLEIRVVHTLEEIQEVHRLVEKIWPEIYTPVIGSEQVAYMLENYQSFKVIQKDLQKGDHYFLLYEGDRAVGYTAYRENSEEIYISKLYLEDRKSVV